VQPFELERHWPRWLCGLTRHRLTEWKHPAVDDRRCLCGRASSSRFYWLTRRLESTDVILGEAFVGWLFRVLP
jgi:hypothetical protein